MFNKILKVIKKIAGVILLIVAMVLGFLPIFFVMLAKGVNKSDIFKAKLMRLPCNLIKEKWGDDELRFYQCLNNRNDHYRWI